MTEALTVFAVQYIYILLIGMQNLNVVGGRYIASITTSLALSASGFYLTAMVAEVQISGQFGLVWWGFVTGGPAGIASAIWIHPRLQRAYKRLMGLCE